MRILAPITCDLIQLYLHAKAAHWNVRGPGFISIHRLFDEVAEAVNEAVDTVAERMGQLDHPVDGSASHVSQMTRLKPMPVGTMDCDSAIVHLCKSLQKTIEGIREGLDQIDSKETEPIIVDILTTTSRELEKWLWFLKSNLTSSLKPARTKKE